VHEGVYGEEVNTQMNHHKVMQQMRFTEFKEVKDQIVLKETKETREKDLEFRELKPFKQNLFEKKRVTQDVKYSKAA